MERIAETPIVSKQERAAITYGGSSNPVHEMVVNIIRSFGIRGKVYDVGCGTGSLCDELADACDEYLGVDLLRHPGFPEARAFQQVDLDSAEWNLPAGGADVVASLETIEHIENPRAFVRSLVRLARPGGLVVITTPNQVSWRSKLSFIFSNQYVAFKKAPGLYPSHITALLEEDLLRIAGECGLTDCRVAWTNNGRIPKLNLRWPAGLGFRGRRFSDNFAVHGIVGATPW